MRTNRLLLVAVTLSGISPCLQAQQDCSQTLILAERAYYTGRFTEIAPLVTFCLQDGFSKEQKVEALKLMGLGYIFSRDFERADSALFTMLKINPQFTLEPEDPPELKKRLEKFDARPVAGISIGGGACLPIIKVKEVYSLRGVSSTVTYESSIGYHLGFGASFYVTKKIVLESSFEAQSVSFEVKKENSFVETRMNEMQRRRELVIAGGYSQKWGGIYGQFLVGAAINSLKSAESNLYKLEKVVDGTGEIIAGEITYREDLKFSNLDHRSSTDLRPLVIARISLEQKNGYLISFSARYEHSSQEFAKDRYSEPAQVVKFDWIEDEFTANYFSLGLSVTKLFYHVRK